VRIIGGEHKGKTIAAARNLSARPTTDFAKEGLFNILANRCEMQSTEVLDLFSGLGSIAFEFASRGCPTVHAVEIEPRNAAFIRAAAGKLGFRQMRVIRQDAFHFLSICKAKYDIVFADPPYDMTRIEEIPGAVFDSGALKPDGMLILEHSKRNDFAGHERLLEHRNYGNVHFSFFKSQT